MYLHRPVFPLSVKDLENVMTVALNTKTLDILDAIIMFPAILEGNGIICPENDAIIKVAWC